VTADHDPIPGIHLTPGKWYGSYPNAATPGSAPAAGPFDTEREARDLLRCILVPTGGVVRQHHGRHPDRK